MAAQPSPPGKRTESSTRRIEEGALRPSGLLLEAHTALAGAIDRHAVSAVGLPPAVVDLLVRLRLAPDNHLRGVDISRQLLIDPSRTSRLIDRAETAGVVVRLPDPTDRRAQRITFTEKGRRAVERFLPLLLAVLDRTVFEVLSPTELETLVSLLLRLRRSARSLAQRDDLSEPGNGDRYE